MSDYFVGFIVYMIDRLNHPFPPLDKHHQHLRTRRSLCPHTSLGDCRRTQEHSECTHLLWGRSLEGFLLFRIFFPQAIFTTAFIYSEFFL